MRIMANWRRMLPKTTTDIFAFFFSLAGINAVFYFEILYVLPMIVNGHTEEEPYSPVKWYIHMICGVYLYFNALSSFWKVISTETGIRGLVLPIMLKPGWKFCPYCECNAPPRSFHCHTCKTCILRRDHHCVFTGNCIGQNNHRYYLLVVFYNAVAGIYACVMNSSVAWEIVEGSSIPVAVLKLIFPFFAWVVGLTSWTQMLLSAIVLLCVAVMCSMTALLGYHLKNLIKGQITHESSHKIFKYNLGWKRNVRAVMGDRWQTAWFSPWIPSKLPGNGLEFPEAQDYESPKDI